MVAAVVPTADDDRIFDVGHRDVAETNVLDEAPATGVDRRGARLEAQSVVCAGKGDVTDGHTVQARVRLTAHRDAVPRADHVIGDGDIAAERA